MAGHMKRSLARRLTWLHELQVYFPKGRMVANVFHALQYTARWAAQYGSSTPSAHQAISQKKAAKYAKLFQALTSEQLQTIRNRTLGDVVKSVEKTLAAWGEPYAAIFQISSYGISLVVTNRRRFPIRPKVYLQLPGQTVHELKLVLKPKEVREILMPVRAGWFEVFSKDGQKMAVIKGKVLEPSPGVRKDRVLGIDLHPDEIALPVHLPEPATGYTVPQLSPCHGDLDRVCVLPKVNCPVKAVKKPLPKRFANIQRRIRRVRQRLTSYAPNYDWPLGKYVPSA